MYVFVFPVADVAVNLTEAGDGTVLAREWPSILNVNFNLKNVDGLDVPKVAEGSVNYIIHIFHTNMNCSNARMQYINFDCSNASLPTRNLDCTNTSIPCPNVRANYTIGNPLELEHSLVVNQTRVISVSIAEEITRKMCEWMQFLCAWVYPNTTAEYHDANSENDMSCIPSPKLCKPGKIIIVCKLLS